MRKPLRTETEGVHFFLRHLSDGQRNAGETIPVSPDQRCEQVNRERRRKAETQRTARKVLNIADRTAADFQLIKRPLHVTQIGLARIGGTYFPTSAIEQLHPHPLLEFADLLGERGLGHMQRAGGAGEAAVVRDGLQIADGDNSISLAYGALRKSVLDSYSSNAQLCL